MNINGSDCIALASLILLTFLKAIKVDTIVDSSILMIVGFYFGFRIKEGINKKR